MGFLDKILLAFAVVMRWETLVTAVGFIAVWLLLRYVADPWVKERVVRRPPRLKPRKKAKPVPGPAPTRSTESYLHDDMPIR